jgi:hypothetical protein
VYSVARDCDNGKVDPKVPPHICILLIVNIVLSSYYFLSGQNKKVIIFSFHENVNIIIELF